VKQNCYCLERLATRTIQQTISGLVLNEAQAQLWDGLYYYEIYGMGNLLTRPKQSIPKISSARSLDDFSSNQNDTFIIT
jgi:hypothetical protein